MERVFLGWDEMPLDAAAAWLVARFDGNLEDVLVALPGARAGRLGPSDYVRAVLYSTLSPCDMCSGAILLYGIRKVVVGENKTFQGPEEYLRSRGADLEVVNDVECQDMMRKFIAENPELWNEDIGEVE